ncbi:MAG: hypothetical protein AB1696_24785 [Planctomycetota bacterium]
MIASDFALLTSTVLLLAPLAALYAADSPATNDRSPNKQGNQLMQDPSFEMCPSGVLPSTSANATWEVQRTGREAIRDRLVVACVDDEAKARSGKKCLLLSIPKETIGFEFVTVGQRLRLAAGKEYEASVWVRWVGGPDNPPPGAKPSPACPSAIVSFWARHRDGKGAFAGRDEWIFDNQWHKLAFPFCATDPDYPTLVYVSLLPNQKPAETTVLLDDFGLAAMDAQAEGESRSGNIVEDSGFDAQRIGEIIPPWNFVNRGGTNISVAACGTGPQRCVTLQMSKDTSNFESAQLRQYLDLRRGVRYDVSCRMRWDNFAPDAPVPIVNYGIYHEGSRTWYGPVDQVLERNGEWNTYRFSHIPPFGGRWRLYAQLNGWGNFGRAVAVSLQDFTCAPAK